MGAQITGKSKHAVIAASEKYQQTHHKHGYDRVIYRPIQRGFENMDYNGVNKLTHLFQSPLSSRTHNTRNPPLLKVDFGPRPLARFARFTD
jgi:hypothetical protein